MKIKHVTAHRILNSAGNYTSCVTVYLADNTVACASVPEGISKGPAEAACVPTCLAIQHIRMLEPELQKLSVYDLPAFDQELITRAGEHKSILGANVTLALSIACARAAAHSRKQPLFAFLQEQFSLAATTKMPAVMALGFEGGKHGNGIRKIQELLFVEESIESARETYQRLRTLLKENNISTAVGAEGGFNPEQLTTEQALKLLHQVSGRMSLDVAADAVDGAHTEFDQMRNLFQFFSVEDPYPSTDLHQWQQLVHSGKTLVVADDLTTTNVTRIEYAIEEKLAQAVIIKPNQIGTITETIRAAQLARSANFPLIVSHRATETNDDFIADLAIALQAEFVKFGGFARGERIAKYNRLLAIKEILDHA